MNLDILKIYLDRAAIKAIENSLPTKLFTKKYVRARTLKTGFSVRKWIHLGIIRLSVNEQTVYGCKPV